MCVISFAIAYIQYHIQAHTHTPYTHTHTHAHTHAHTQNLKAHVICYIRICIYIIYTLSHTPIYCTYTQRVILEKDYRALKREKSNELNYVNQKLAAEEESNRVLLKRVPLHDQLPKLDSIVLYIVC